MSDQLARYKQALRAERAKNRELETALGEAVTLIESRPDPAALQARLDQLHEAMTEGAYRVAWEAAAEKAGVDPKHLDDLWRLDPPKIDADAEPDPKALDAHLKQSVKARPLFATPAKDEAEADGDDQADAPEAGAEAEADGDDPFGLFADEAPAKAAAPAKDKDRPQPKAAAPKPKLADGEGSARGGRAGGTKDDPFAAIDRDFAATGRNDPFKL